MRRRVLLPLAVAGALVASAVQGLLVAALAAPVVAGTGLLVKDQVDDYFALPADLQTPALPERSQLLAADGSHLAWLYLENRVHVPRLEQIPEHTRRAVLAVEDARFYDHAGVDVKGTLRAAVENARAGGVSQGGSTLTQQYVKNALLAAATTPQQQDRARETTVERKMREARYALALERRTSKDDILLAYLNIAYFGNGTHGIATAASFYFAKEVEQLTLPESALLAGLVQSPARHDPVRHPEAAVQRRDTVLARMAEVGWISEQERAEAAATPLELRLAPARAGCEAPDVNAPFFCDYVRRALEEGPLGEALGSTREERQQRLLGGGLTVRTTLNPGLQAVAQQTLAQRIPSTDPSGVAAVYTAVVPGTGEVRAMAVNRRYGGDDRPGHTKLNLALGGSSGMQAGSTIKPFVLAAALQKGLPLNTTFDAPAQYTSDVFVNCNGQDCDEPYTVANAGDSNAGRHDMVSGTHGSVNTYYLQLLEKTGVEQPAALAEAMGLRQVVDGRAQGPLHRGGSFVLGANEVSPLDLSAAYAGFAARGRFCPPRPVTEVLDTTGEPLPLPDLPCRQVLDPALADTVTSVLRGTIDGPSPGRTASRADIGRPAAGKTGSTNGSKAAWFAGYVPHLAASVWIGKTTPEDMRDITIGGQHYRQVYGGTLPAPLWGLIMGTALRDIPVAAMPPHAVADPQPLPGDPPEDEQPDADAVR